MMNLPIDIERSSGIPLYVQLEEQIRLLVRRGTLRTGDALPTVRSLAVSLGINANTVARVYRDLQREGLLRLERGVGTFVAPEGAERAVTEETFARIRAVAWELVGLSRAGGLRSGEVKRLIENLWKENPDDER